MSITLTNENKSNITLTGESRIDSPTWDEDTHTWDDTTENWDTLSKPFYTKETKNNITLTNQNE
jgi:hypothetical protein